MEDKDAMKTQDNPKKEKIGRVLSLCRVVLVEKMKNKALNRIKRPETK